MSQVGSHTFNIQPPTTFPDSCFSLDRSNTVYSGRASTEPRKYRQFSLNPTPYLCSIRVPIRCFGNELWLVHAIQQVCQLSLWQCKFLLIKKIACSLRCDIAEHRLRPVIGWTVLHYFHLVIAISICEPNHHESLCLYYIMAIGE